MYEMDLALNNLEWFICHKTKKNFALSTGAVEYTDYFSAGG